MTDCVSRKSKTCVNHDSNGQWCVTISTDTHVCCGKQDYKTCELDLYVTFAWLNFSLNQFFQTY